MIAPGHAVMLATYNEWMNDKLYAAAGKLTAAELALDRTAFFRSITGTLNHIVVGDTIWLKRFAAHPARHAALDPVRSLPAPTALDAVPFADFAQLREHRKMLDQVIKAWAAALTEDDLRHVLHYSNTKGVPAQKRFGSLVAHFFNHQTHHRGQASTLLFQAGQDVGVTDLLVLVPDETGA